MIVPTLPALMLYSPTQHFPIFVNKSKQAVLYSMSKPLCVDRKLWRDRRTDTFETIFYGKKWRERRLCTNSESFSLSSTPTP